MSKYDDLLKSAKADSKTFHESARDYIPKMCKALKDENPESTKDDIRDRIDKDCIEIWSKRTIRDALPEEYKHEEMKRESKKKEGEIAAVLPQIEVLTDGSVQPPESGDKEKPSSPKQGQIQPTEWKSTEPEDVEGLKTKLNDSLVYISKLEAINKNLTDLKSKGDKDDITNHPMYLRAQALIETERKEKEGYKQRVEELDKDIFKTADEVPNPPELFQIPKDIVSGAYYEKISPIQAISKIKAFMNSEFLEIGWRIIKK